MQELIDGTAAIYAELRAAATEYYNAELEEYKAEQSLKDISSSLMLEGKVEGRNEKEREASLHAQTLEWRDKLQEAKENLIKAKLRMALADLDREMLQVRLAQT